MVSTSVVPTENGGSIPPRTCGQDAGLRLTLKKEAKSLKKYHRRVGVKKCATLLLIPQTACARAAISPVWPLIINPLRKEEKVCLLCLEIRRANRIRSDSEMVITSVFETGVRGSIPRRSIVLGMTL